MRKTIFTLFMMGLFLFAGALPARAARGGVVRFATLPPGAGHPEGIAADRRGNIYVATFDFTLPNVIHVFVGTSGQLAFTIPLPGGTLPLGLAFDSA